MSSSSRDIIDDVAIVDSIYRVAFPACRVFIYGKEVTQDVIGVRVFQSGGSLERSPSTCAITLANQSERYTITHEDMTVIGLKKRKVLKQYGDITGSYTDGADPTTANGDGYYNPNVGMPKYDENGNLVGGIPNPIGASKTFDMSLLNVLAPKLAVSTNEEARYLLQALDPAFANISAEQARSIASYIRQTVNMAAEDMGYASKTDVIASWEDAGLVAYAIKSEVVNQKMTFTYNMKYDTKDSKYLNYEDRLVFDFPFQEGDCIFHPNDPIRVAFRDPFDPRMWYWQFTGFVDSWTEEMGSNFESEITVTCTDITKILRYSIIETKGLQTDQNLDKVATDQTGNVASSNTFIYNSSVFRDLTLIEALEVIFFGGVGLVNLASASALSFADSLSSLTKDELSAFLIDKFGMSAQEIYKYVPIGYDSIPLEDSSRNITLDPLRNRVINDLGLKRIESYAFFDSWQPISSPRGVKFKRESDATGISYFVYGEPNITDTAFGAFPIKDLYTWNETIHHRVRKADLNTMRDEEKYPTPFTNVANLTIEQVISEIGLNPDKYPVGHGRVFFFTMARTNETGMDDIFDRGIAQVSAVWHSTFKDHLSYLYDVADEIEFRFYATPRGDIVLELPMYDWSPRHFFKNATQARMDSTKQTLRDMHMTYEDIFKQAYGGDYDEADTLTNLAFTLNTTDVDIIDFMTEPVFDYENCFTIETHEQTGFSNTCTDRGVVTYCRVLGNTIAQFSGLNNDAARQEGVCYSQPLMRFLGIRPMELNPKGFVGNNSARVYSALKMNQINAEARNIGVETVPKFGLMVNRPVWWKYRNYLATIISLNHNFTWMNDCNTTVNLNQARAWSGEYTNEEDGVNRPVYRFYGDYNRLLNFAEFMAQAKAPDKGGSNKGGV